MIDFDFYKRSKALALLLDPDKTLMDDRWLQAIIQTRPDFILIGGSQPFASHKLNTMVEKLKDSVSIPLIGFPGDYTQIHEKLDALLALSVVQSNNARFILDPIFKISDFIISHPQTTYFTPYFILGQTGTTSVELVLKDSIQKIQDTSQLVPFLIGLTILNPKVIYLEAGSGSRKILDLKFVSTTKCILKNAYIFAGGGVRSSTQAKNIWESGADCLVVGNWVEESLSALFELADARNHFNAKLN